MKQKIISRNSLNKILPDKQLYYLQRLTRLCEKYKEIVLTYEKDDFGASGVFLADVYLIKQMFSELENTDLKDGAINAKKKLKELWKTHSFFGKI